MTPTLIIIADIKTLKVEKRIKLSFKVMKVARLAIVMVAIEEVKPLAIY